MKLNRLPLNEILSKNSVVCVLALKAVAVAVLALKGWSDGRDHLPALIIVLLSTTTLEFCLYLVMVRSRKARRQAALAKRRLREAEKEDRDAKAKLRFVSQTQWKYDRDAGRLRADCNQHRDALLQERARLPLELEMLENRLQTALERFNGEVQKLRTRSVNGFRTTLADLRAFAALRHRLQPRVCGVRFNREHSLKITKDAEKEFLQAIDSLIASDKTKTNQSYENTTEH